MKDLQIVEYSNQRILTTAQIAEAYGTTPQIVSRNFTRNKDRYTAGKHYIYLEGETLEQFKSELLTKSNRQIDDRNLYSEIFGTQNTNMIRSLYLWTEKGAWLLAKSLNTDEAWQACEKLVDEYYRVKEQLAIALVVVEELGTMLDAIYRGDADFVASFNATKSLDLPMLNSINDILDNLAEQQQAKLLPKRIIYPLSDESKEVLAVLDQAGCPVSLKELAVALGKEEYTVLKTVFNMLCHQEIKRIDDAYVSLILRDEI